MRVLIVAIAFAAALVAAAPASAQRMSLADRVALLEQRAADNRVSMDLLNQVSELRAEVQALRALVEELQQQNEQLRASSRTQYLDLDGRLNRLEGGIPAAPDEGTVRAAAGARTAGTRRGRAAGAWRSRPAGQRRRRTLRIRASVRRAQVRRLRRLGRPVPGLPAGLPGGRVRAQCPVLARRELLRHPE